MTPIRETCPSLSIQADTEFRIGYFPDYLSKVQNDVDNIIVVKTFFASNFNLSDCVITAEQDDITFNKFLNLQ